MAGSDHGVWIEIDPAYKCNLGLLSSIDKPDLLVLAKTRLGSVPPNTNIASVRLKPIEMILRSPERIEFELFSLAVRSPADQADIKPTCRRTAKYV